MDRLAATESHTEPELTMSNIETIAVHAGREGRKPGDPIADPIITSTVFHKTMSGELVDGLLYTRHDNPNRRALESCLAQLEGGAAAAAFGSGSAASMALFHALAHGDHVVAPIDVYYGTRVMLDSLYARWGLNVSYVDLTDLSALQGAITESTRLVWLETPSNPLLTITDVAAICEIAHRAGSVAVVDNTWPTPVLQRPLVLGADIAMHSTTKYLGGHADLLGGCVIAREENEFFERVREYQKVGGAAPAPFDCWLLRRSIATLPYRMRAHCENAARIATALSEHPAVEIVHYPGLPSHGGHDIAARQMSDYGGMLSFQVRGGRKESLAVAGRVKLISHATSLGGVESLIEHRASVEAPGSGTPDNLLRLSVGIESVGDILDDLLGALET
jgi:cystathionine gamma-synthase